jgi:hypothetical protein
MAHDVIPRAGSDVQWPTNRSVLRNRAGVETRRQRLKSISSSRQRVRRDDGRHGRQVVRLGCVVVHEVFRKEVQDPGFEPG